MVKKKQLALQKATLKNENDENSNKLNYVPNEFDNVCKGKGKQVDGAGVHGIPACCRNYLLLPAPRL